MTEERSKAILTVFGTVFLLLFCLFPFAWMVVISCSGAPDFLSPSSSYGFTLQHYKDIVSHPSLHFADYLRNSLLISAVAAIFATCFAGLSAYAITRMSFPGKILIPTAMLALSMFPQISVIGYLFRLMTWLGWINTYNGLIMPYISLGLPLALWIMISYFSQLPQDLDKAALVDGATRFQILRKVIFPIAAPGAFSTVLLLFIFCFNEFLFALMLTVDYNARTVPVGIALFQGLHGQIPWGIIMAAAVVSSLPIVSLAAVFQRHIVQGLTQGALKA